LSTRYVALGLVNVILTLSPEKIVLGGGVMARAGLLERVRADVVELLGGYVRAADIVAPRAGRAARRVGCARAGRGSREG
jgi:fructokinase